MNTEAKTTTADPALGDASGSAWDDDAVLLTALAEMNRHIESLETRSPHSHASVDARAQRQRIVDVLLSPNVQAQTPATGASADTHINH